MILKEEMDKFRKTRDRPIDEAKRLLQNIREGCSNPEEKAAEIIKIVETGIGWEIIGLPDYGRLISEVGISRREYALALIKNLKEKAIEMPPSIIKTIEKTITDLVNNGLVNWRDLGIENNFFEELLTMSEESGPEAK
jgi:hypothetical protein